MPDHNEYLTQMEVNELEQAFKIMLSTKDADSLIEKAQRLVMSEPDLESEKGIEVLISSGNNSNQYFQNFTAHFNNEDMMRMAAA